MDKSITIRHATIADCEAISHVAAEIWWQHYPGIITDEQIAYMLNKGANVPALKLQMTDRSQIYWVAEQSGEIIAYSAYSLKTDGQESWVYVNKLYALVRTRGMGIGHKLLRIMVDDARQRGIATLRLNVNKYNPTVAWYLQNGFTVRKEVVLPVGFGFVMDDFILELKTTDYPF
jgi:ribosomal protein S18 acetylase RimI-like enzyme